MATVRSRAQPPVGSAQWILDEQNIAEDFIDQGVEEFAFSARNEMEWLNEHMADIFNRSQFDVVEAFKTPGKLRGKTPRTARKRNAFENRAPLTDVFTTNIQRPAPNTSQKSAFSKQIEQFQVAEDKDDSHVAETSISSRFSLGTGKENTDSGYHDMTEDEMDVDQTVVNSQPLYRSPPKPQYILSVPQQPERNSVPRNSPAPYREGSQDTFVSASEERADQNQMADEAHDDENATQPDEDVEDTIAPQPNLLTEDVPATQLDQDVISAATATATSDKALEQPERDSPAHQSIESGDSSPSSDGSSPQRLIVRKKSSLNFASLPAREPLATKKSVGARMSHADPSRLNNTSREDNHGRQTFGKPTRESQQPNTAASVSKLQHEGNEEGVDLGNKDAEVTLELSEATREHSKTSTQRLQERLAMLTKSNTTRPSKSIPSGGIASQIPTTHVVQQSKNQESSSRRPSEREENEESWIGPMKTPTHHIESPKADPSSQLVTEASNQEDNALAGDQEQTPKPTAELKAEQPTSATNNSVAPNTIPSETHVSLSYPQLRQDFNSSSNAADSIKNDGPISASKAKLFSVFKSAKGIFASSASVSAQAKMEALSASQSSADGAKALSDSRAEPANLSARDNVEQDEQPNLPRDLPNFTEGLQNVEPVEKDDERGASLRSSARLRKAEEAANESKTRDEVEHNVAVDDLPELRPKTAEPARIDEPKISENQRQNPTISTVPASEGDESDQENMPPPPPPKSQFTGSQMHKGELRRPNRPPKDTVPPKSRPAPVSIRLASQRIGHMGPSTGAGGSSHQESVPPAVPPKQPSLSKKASNASLHTSSSTQSFKTTASSASSRPKALEVAARKKEQDEREAQRKAEQKREIERRRIAKAEEERRAAVRAAQEQKAAESRAQEARQQAQKQALEQRKADALRRTEQQRNQAAAARNKQPEDFASLPDNEPRQAPQNHVRSDAPTIRPVSRMGSTQESSRPAVPHINPAKPPKRQFNPDDDYSQKPLPARPGQPDQQPKKRRRTSEDSFVETVSRPTMAPPVRPSMMRKQENMNKYAQGFMNHANSAHASSSMLKTTINNQHQLQHPKTPHMNDLAKYSTARIPFADAPNLPQAGTFSTQQNHQQQRPQQPLKTPNSVTNVHHKSSPQYPNGDSIDLPEIATDSEDSDDDNDFVPPDWANSPALRELLKDQQLVDPLKVFGPIAPLMMEDIFKGNKDRMARFRNRTSSANWNGPDRLTEEEVRKDREARERLEREGGWTFRGGST